jgi:PEP-CTERM motif
VVVAKIGNKLIAAMMVSAGMASSAIAVVPLQITATANPLQFTTTITQTRTGPGSGNFTNTTTAGTVSVNRFDTSTGILVGATATVNTAYAVSSGVTGSVPQNGSGRTVDAVTTQTGSVSIGGATISGSSLTVTPGCNGGDCLNSPNNNSRSAAGTISGTATITDLASVAGSGPGTTLFTTTSSGTTQITNGSNTTSGSAVSNYTFGGTTQANNQYSITYSYVEFSTPSFSSGSVFTAQTLDFGTRFAGSGTATQSFTVANIGGINTAGTSLIGTTLATNNSSFSTSLTALTNLEAGTSQNFQVAFNPTTAGNNTETFTFAMQDYAPGGVGLQTTNLVLTANARVINHALPSFDPLSTVQALTLDFGNLALGSGLVTLNFSLANIGDGNSAGLSLVSASSLTSNFTSSLTALSNLPGGQSQLFTLSFDPTTLGSFNDMFTFNLIDFAPGVSGGQNYELKLTAIARVYDPEVVPEPGTWMMMLLGFGLVGAISRRTRRTAQAA